MKYLKLFFAIAVLSAVFGAFVSESVTAENESAKCAVLSVENAYQQAGAVFIGKVLSEEKRGDVRYFEFEVEKYWKGANKKKIEIGVYETVRYQANFQTGERYLIYAKANDEGKLSVGRCSRSRPADGAKEDLEKLGAGKKPN
jgi:hypothetical protein